MIIPVQLLLCFLFLIIYCNSHHKLSGKKVIVVFFSTSIVIMNLYTVIGMNLKYIMISLHSEEFVGFLLFRNLVLPLFFTMICGYLNSSQYKLKRGGHLLLFFSGITLLEIINLHFRVYTYNHWYFGLTLLMFLFVLLFILLVLHLYEKAGEGDRNESV